MPEPRRRVLLVTRNLPPLVGGMERLNWHIADELARHAEVRIIAPCGSAALAPADVRVVEVPLRPLWRFLLEATWQALRVAIRWKPDLVLAGSGLTAPVAKLAARLSGARTAVYAHGLDLAVRHPIYRVLWLPFVRKMDRLVANSRATAELAIRAGVAADKVGLVHPGAELPASEPDAQVLARLRAKHALGGRPVLLSVGRLSTRKGLCEFVSLGLPRIAAAHPDVLLLIVGDAPADALHAQAQTPDSIRSAAEHVGLLDNLRFLGAITDYTELGAIYGAADVHVFPVREIPGDPEGFGMVAVEAAAHGLPTVAFASGGVVDAIADGLSGYLVEAGNYPSFAKAVLKALASRQMLAQSSRNFAERFAWPQFGRAIADQLGITPSSDRPI